MRRVAFLVLTALVALAPLACKKSESVKEQERDRAAFAVKTLFAEDAGRSFGVSSRPDVVFEDGFGRILHDNKGPSESVHYYAFRWMGQNAHLRVHRHDDHRMRLVVGGWVNHEVLHTNPTLTAYFDGMRVGFTPPITREVNNGQYRLEAIIEPEMWRGRDWCDVNIITSSVAFHWYEPPMLFTVLTYFLEWSEIP